MYKHEKQEMKKENKISQKREPREHKQQIFIKICNHFLLKSGYKPELNRFQPNFKPKVP